MLKEENLSEKFIKKWSWLFLFSFFIAPSGYIIKALISNDLSVEEVWIIYSIVWLISFLAIYNDLGFSESLRYFLPKFWINKEYNKFKSSIVLALLVKIITAILIAILLWLGADFIAEYYIHYQSASTILKVFSLFFIVFSLFRVISDIFFSFQDTFAYKFVEFIRMRSIVIFVSILFFSDLWSMLNYAIARFVWTIIWTITAIILLIKKYKNILKKWKILLNKDLSKKMASYAIWSVLAIQWWLILWSIDLQMIVYFLWPKAAWFYTNYQSLLNVYMILLWPIFAFIFPVTSELIARKEKWKLEKMINMFYKYFTVIGIIFWLFFSTFWTYISYILFWEKFIFSGELLKLWALFVFLNILISINFNVLSGLGKVKNRMKIIWTAAIFNIITNAILIPKIWEFWAIITTICGWIIMFIYSLILIKKEWIKISIDKKFILKNTFTAVSIVSILYYINYKFHLLGNHRIESLKYLSLFLVIYGISLLFINLKEIKLFINEIKKIKK